LKVLVVESGPIGTYTKCHCSCLFSMCCNWNI